MRIHSKVRIPATVALLAGFAVALVGTSGGRHIHAPDPPIIRGLSAQTGGMHMFPPHTPIIKG